MSASLDRTTDNLLSQHAWWQYRNLLHGSQRTTQDWGPPIQIRKQPFIEPAEGAAAERTTTDEPPPAL